MDKRIILAVAGSGKTTSIIKQINENDRALIIAFTDNNYGLLKMKLSEKFKGIPKNISVKSYFSFLYSFCFRPFEGLLRSNGIIFDYDNINYKKSGSLLRYMNKNRYLYSNYLAEYILINHIEDVKNRIKKYFDYLYIDEIQDFASYDFELIKRLAQIDMNILYVGDFYQHTFSTSRAGSKNSTLYDDYRRYLSNFEEILTIDTELLKKSYRCKKNVCDFVTSKLGIQIIPYYENYDVNVKLISSPEGIDLIMRDKKIMKLFYNNHHKYKCRSDNWGNCKGLSFVEVCVILTSEAFKCLKKGTFNSLKSGTRNRFYVACTRSSGNLYFIEGKKVSHYKVL